MFFLIASGEVCLGGQKHFYMETQSMLAVPKGEDKEMDLYVSTQHPAIVQVMPNIHRKSVWTLKLSF